MSVYFKHHWLSVSIAVSMIMAAVFFSYRVLHHNPLGDRIIHTVDRGNVTEIVSITGEVTTASLVDLAFPTSGGIVSTVYVKEGDTVAADDVLATLSTDSLINERVSALAALRLAEADLSELTAGPRTEARALTTEAVATAEAELARVTQEQAELIAAAERTLRSSGLTARSADPNDEATAPIISGTYTCTEEGAYRLSIYRANSDSGYAYELSGLENGRAAATVNQPAPLGTCGLFAQFAAGDKYQNTNWIIAVPNPLSSLYVTNKNALVRAKETASITIARAEEALARAQLEAKLSNAPARTEALTRAEARVLQARAQLAQVETKINDRSIIAPFAGVVTRVDVTRGETVSAAPVISVLANDAFEIEARIPEIDITKISVGASAVVTFDARPDEPQTATVTYLSPLPTQINGVAYFTAKLQLTEAPPWLRGGFNADIDILVEERTDVVRIPRRFLLETESGFQVLSLSGTTISSSTVEVLFIGNDGYVAVSGLTDGSQIVAP